MRPLLFLIPLALAAPAAAETAECAALKRAIAFQTAAMAALTDTLDACAADGMRGDGCAVALSRVQDMDIRQSVADLATLAMLGIASCAD